jgi:aspartate dehydrogenase
MATTPRIVFIGWGAINSRVGALLAERQSLVEIVGIATSGRPNSPSIVPAGITLVEDTSQLAGLRPDLIVEAAGRAAIERWAPAALVAAPALLMASTSAFVDDALLARLAALAERNGSKILIPSGAIGGIDALGAAAVQNLEEVLHQVVKPPLAWKSTRAESLVDLAGLKERTVFFSGTARQAADQYPQNANATVVTALAGIGLDKTRVELVADPTISINGHRIVARGDFGRMEIVLENNPLKSNPKSSELTALSLVRLIEQHVKTVII